MGSLRPLVAWLALLALAAPTPAERLPEEPEGFTAQLVAAAKERTRHWIWYSSKYRKIPYPGGDVPRHIGVCTDVVIRAYRALGIDLQVLVHEDMKADFAAYPDDWGLTGPDPNIDHRRVPNLETFFRRHGVVLPVSRDPGDYRPGDLVTWTIRWGRPHIGIVVDERSRDGERFKVVHNIGLGPRTEDMLFDYPIRGHFRFYGLAPETADAS